MESKQSKFNKSFLWKIIAIVTFAIMFIPMMYSLFYLGAFWDPYGSLKDVPVAFVNLDEPYMKDGKDYTYGKDLEKKLKDNDSFKWEFISYNKAKKGVDGASYYAMIVVPKDFSKKLANSTSGDFQKPQIIYRANKGRNFIFSQLSLKGAESIQNQISSNISKETSKVLVDKLYEVKASLKDASDAQNKIQDGTQKLLDGSGTLATNLVTAFDGSNKLKTGLDSAVTASSTLKSGLDQLFNGSITLNNGLNSAYSGSTALSGLSALAEGQKRVVGGLNDLSNNLTQFKTTINVPGGDMDTLINSSKSASNIADGLNTGVKNLNDAVSTNLEDAASGVDNVNQNIDSVDQLLQRAMDELSTDPSQAKEDMEKAKNTTAALKQITPQISERLRASKNVVSDNLSTAAAGLKQYNAGIYAGTLKAQAKTSGTIDKFIGGIKPLQDGSSTIYTNLNAAASKTSDFTNGLSQLSNGSKNLMTGLGAASNGAGQLTSGLNTATSSTGTLASGLGQLSDGAKTLNSGLGTLNDGTTKLKTGLNDGYSKLNDNLKFTSNDMSKFVSDPVKLSDQSINDVKNTVKDLHHTSFHFPYGLALCL
ncbi:YhgE/Pip domain-containing protein [Clostridium sp. DMHC 10]|uniref:YhgE/Pip domain-containing protein n=1 Tax=Clostridium sp. DMHC 10 TaxID=747377 RepID=UPI000A571A6B|nr:YhgE/Pip domain-containing protein [Clostridium sp. DMHC 10]